MWSNRRLQMVPGPQWRRDNLPGLCMITFPSHQLGWISLKHHRRTVYGCSQKLYAESSKTATVIYRYLSYTAVCDIRLSVICAYLWYMPIGDIPLSVIYRYLWYTAICDPSLLPRFPYLRITGQLSIGVQMNFSNIENILLWSLASCPITITVEVRTILYYIPNSQW